jgi:hypothetical protein
MVLLAEPQRYPLQPTLPAAQLIALRSLLPVLCRSWPVSSLASVFPMANGILKRDPEIEEAQPGDDAAHCAAGDER